MFGPPQSNTVRSKPTAVSMRNGKTSSTREYTTPQDCSSVAEIVPQRPVTPDAILVNPIVRQRTDAWIAHRQCVV